jgi:hypothetical protein
MIIRESQIEDVLATYPDIRGGCVLTIFLHGKQYIITLPNGEMVRFLGR